MRKLNTERTDPAQNLDALEADAAEIVNSLRTESDSSLACIAAGAACGVSRLRQMMKTGAGSAPISVARAALLPAAQRMRLAELILGGGFIVAEAPGVAGDLVNDAGLLLEQMDKTSAASRAVVAAFADGRIDRMEGSDLVRVGTAQARMGMTIAACGEAAVREGVCGVRPLRSIKG